MRFIAPGRKSTSLSLRSYGASSERGVTLIEALMVLGLATTFIGGGTSLYNQINNSRKKVEAQQEVIRLAVAIRTRYPARKQTPLRGRYTGFNINQFPDFELPWSGSSVLIARATSSTTDPAKPHDNWLVFLILPPGECQQLFDVITRYVPRLNRGPLASTRCFPGLRGGNDGLALQGF